MDPSRRPKPLPQVLKEIDDASSPITGRATDFPNGWNIEPHVHAKHQLIYAVRGVMVVQAQAGRWVVPPTRAIWPRLVSSSDTVTASAGSPRP